MRGREEDNTTVLGMLIRPLSQVRLSAILMAGLNPTSHVLFRTVGGHLYWWDDACRERLLWRLDFSSVSLQLTSFSLKVMPTMEEERQCFWLVPRNLFSYSKNRNIIIRPVAQTLWKLSHLLFMKESIHTSPFSRKCSNCQATGDSDHIFIWSDILRTQCPCKWTFQVQFTTVVSMPNRKASYTLTSSETKLVHVLQDLMHNKQSWFLLHVCSHAYIWTVSEVNDGYI